MPRLFAPRARPAGMRARESRYSIHVFLRRLEPDDVSALRAMILLHAKATRSELAYRLQERCGSTGSHRWEEWVTAGLDGVDGFVALEGRFMVGALPYRLDANGNRATLLALVIDPQCSTPDLAGSLLRQTLNWLRVLGVTEITTTVFTDTHAHTTYVEDGFTPRQALRQFGRDGAELPLVSSPGLVNVREARMNELPRLTELGLCDGQVRAYWLAEVDGAPLCVCRAELDLAAAVSRVSQLRTLPVVPAETPGVLLAQVTQALIGRGAQVCLGECEASDNVARLSFQRAGFLELGVLEELRHGTATAESITPP